MESMVAILPFLRDAPQLCSAESSTRAVEFPAESSTSAIELPRSSRQRCVGFSVCEGAHPNVTTRAPCGRRISIEMLQLPTGGPVMMMLMFTMMMTRCAVESSSKSRVTTHESQLTTSHETSSSHTTATSGVYAPLHLVLQSSLEGTVSKSLAGVWTTPRTCVTGSRPTAGQLLGEWTAFFTFYVAVIPGTCGIERNSIWALPK